MKQIIAFNAELQRDTLHNVIIDGNGEFVLMCTESGRQWKIAADSREDFEQSLIKHKEANLGQISVESLEKKMSEILP